VPLVQGREIYVSALACAACACTVLPLHVGCVWCLVSSECVQVVAVCGAWRAVSVWCLEGSECVQGDTRAAGQVLRVTTSHLWVQVHWLFNKLLGCAG
jgi:hypothetical protein